MKSIGSSDSTKDLCESIHTNVEILKEWNSDSSDSIATSLNDIKEKIGSPFPTDKTMDKVVEAVDKMSLQLTTMKTLIVDTLTVMSCSYVNYDFDLIYPLAAFIVLCLVVFGYPLAM